MKTIRYYTKGGIYKGWEKFDSRKELVYRSWIKSGNYLMTQGIIQDWLIRDIKTLRDIIDTM